VSVVTIAELRLGVLAAPDVESRAQRLETLSRAEALEPLPVDRDVAGAWARLRLALRDAGRRMPLNDSWIAATALAHRIPVVSQDGDYDGVPLIELVRV
jgi:predicted nucleic acid-binding protein